MALGDVLFRCDANASIGTGHVMRCLALAQAIRAAGGRSRFVAAEMPEGLQQRLASEGFDAVALKVIPGSLEDANLLLGHDWEKHADWLVIDGDRFGSDFLWRLKNSSIRTLLLDDFAERDSFPADQILNPNFGATEEPYRLAGFRGLLLLGERYVPLRREFVASPSLRTFAAKGNRVLITLGGSDPENLAPRIVRALAVEEDLKITLIVGAGYAHANDLLRMGGENVEAQFNVSDMRAQMAGADLAVIAAGGTLWELLYMGCVVLSYARNPVQAQVITKLANMGIVADMGNTRDFSTAALVARVRELVDSRPAREGMATNGTELIDGLGAQRVVEALARIEGRV